MQTFAKRKILSTQITEFESVEMATIDRLNLPKAHLMKIDVDSME